MNLDAQGPVTDWYSELLHCCGCLNYTAESVDAAFRNGHPSGNDLFP